MLYLHNAVEAQMQEVGETELLHRLHEAFVWLEHARQDGLIRAYGMATWDCFRRAPLRCTGLCTPVCSRGVLCGPG